MLAKQNKELVRNHQFSQQDKIYRTYWQGGTIWRFLTGILIEEQEKQIDVEKKKKHRDKEILEKERIGKERIEMESIVNEDEENNARVQSRNTMNAWEFS